jgi:ubiquinone/menaquinone biosynthesis C-methylase UbiE
MGCGAGALAIPCAERGHKVLAADFSPAMLERCRAGLSPEVAGLVRTRLLAWDDDWEAAGVGERSFDVAFASRSIATPDMEAAIVKLSRVARRRVCVTVVAGGSPRVSEAFLADLGLTCTGHPDAAFAFGIATQLGYRPSVQFIGSERTDLFETREEAHRAYLDMLRFADAPVQGDAAALRQHAREWVDVHLHADCDGRLAIDIPRTFSWAFLAWEV